MKKKSKVERVKVPAPAKLAQLFAGAGFKVSLIVRRSDTSLDSGAFLPDPSAPVSAQMRNDIKALLAAYEVDEGGGDTDKRFGDGS